MLTETNVSCAQGAPGPVGFQLRPVSRETLGMISMQLAFPTSVKSPIADGINWNMSLDTNLELTFPAGGVEKVTPSGSVARDVGAVSLEVTAALLLDIYNWIRGRRFFPIREALAVSAMGRLLQVSIDAWNGAVDGECPTQENFDRAIL